MAFGILGAIFGVLLVITGIYMIVFLPFTSSHQGDFGHVGIITGIVFTVIGLLLFFLP